MRGWIFSFICDIWIVVNFSVTVEKLEIHSGKIIQGAKSVFLYKIEKFW